MASKLSISKWRDYVRLLMKDPMLAPTYLIKGKEGLLRHCLSRLTEISVPSIHQEFVDAGNVLQQALARADSVPYLGWVRSGEILYVAVRIMKPSLVVETGVAAGLSTTCILAALDRNGQGELHSIDLPDYEKTYFPSLGLDPVAILPKNRAPGFLVPEELSARWHLHLGDTRKILPSLLGNLDQIALFLHDSEHTFDTMMFEYDTVWPHLPPGGLLLSDDVDWNDAFSSFSLQHHQRPVYFWNSGLAGVAKSRLP